MSRPSCTTRASHVPSVEARVIHLNAIFHAENRWTIGAPWSSMGARFCQFLVSKPQGSRRVSSVRSSYAKAPIAIG